jgi:hypothetical protein
MKKSLKNFIKKLQVSSDNPNGSQGFTVLKNIRGGVGVPDGNNANYCQNDGTCNGTNSHYCSNNRCGDGTNTGCTNYGSCFE